MPRDATQFEFELSPEIANEINLLRCQWDNATSLAEAVNRLILRGLAGAWQQTNEVSRIAYERARLRGEESERMKVHRAKISTCDDALSRLAKLASRKAVLHKRKDAA